MNEPVTVKSCSPNVELLPRRGCLICIILANVLGQPKTLFPIPPDPYCLGTITIEGALDVGNPRVEVATIKLPMAQA